MSKSIGYESLRVDTSLQSTDYHVAPVTSALQTAISYYNFALYELAYNAFYISNKDIATIFQNFDSQDPRTYKYNRYIVYSYYGCGLSLIGEEAKKQIGKKITSLEFEPTKYICTYVPSTDTAVTNMRIALSNMHEATKYLSQIPESHRAMPLRFNDDGIVFLPTIQQIKSLSQSISTALSKSTAQEPWATRITSQFSSSSQSRTP